MCGDVYSRIVIYTDIVVNNLLFFSEFFLGGAHNNTSQVFLVFFFLHLVIFSRIWLGFIYARRGRVFKNEVISVVSLTLRSDILAIAMTTVDDSAGQMMA